MNMHFNHKAWVPCRPHVLWSWGGSESLEEGVACLSHRCLASVLARLVGRGDRADLDSVRSWRNIQLLCGCGVSGTLGDWGLLPVWGFQNIPYICIDIDNGYIYISNTFPLASGSAWTMVYQFLRIGKASPAARPRRQLLGRIRPLVQRDVVIANGCEWFILTTGYVVN